METIKVNINKITPHAGNPRVIKDDSFKKLVKSIQEFPEMMEARPIVCNRDGIIIGGTMRHRAAKAAGVKDVFVTYVDFTTEQEKEFMIKDNVSGGEWDWEILANEWDASDLTDWGLDVPNFEADVDYSLLDDEEADKQAQEMNEGVKKAIQIEFEMEHYEDAYNLVKYWREQNAYVGGMIMEYLKSEKSKNEKN
jgi:ParB-like chromosome segregation protein Spo0J